MEHNRKQKLLMIIALVVGIASLSIGFAAFSTTLNISSSASVTPSSDTFKVKFSTSGDSLVEGSVSPSGNSYSLTTTNGVIDNSSNPTLTNLSATFTSPGQTVVYTVYARNEGEYTAYLNNVNFIGDKTCTPETGTSESLAQSACDDINVYVIIDDTLYDETTLITGHSLASGSGEKVNIVLEYKGSVFVDGPMSITFPNVALVYSTIDDSSMQPSEPKIVQLESGDLNTPGSIVSIGEEQFYVFGQEDGNVKLLSMYNLYVGYVVDFSDASITTISGSLGIQDETAKGYCVDENGVEISPFIGTTEFSYTGVEYSGSTVEGYVENYATYLEGLGANITEARLITKEELEILGCSGDDWTCSEAPSWVYSTSYWSASSYDGSVWAVAANGERFGYGPYDDFFDFGVRPVIEISLSEF